MGILNKGKERDTRYVRTASFCSLLWPVFRVLAYVAAGLAALLGRRLGKRASRAILALCAAFTVLLLLAAVWFACYLRFREPG